MARPDVPAITSGGSLRRHMVTVPHDSVRPYAVNTVENPSWSRMACTSSTGTTAAPVTPNRNDERSYSSRRRSANNVWYKRRRPRQHGDPLGRYPLHHRGRVEDRFGHHRRPRHQAGQDPGLVAEGVEERVDHQVAITGGQADDGGPRPEGPQTLGVRGRRTLGVARGARGEDHVRDVVGTDGGRPPCRLGRVDALARSEIRRQTDDAVPLRPATLVAQQHRPLQIADVFTTEQGGIVDPQEAAHGEEGGGSRGAQEVTGLGPLEARCSSAPAPPRRARHPTPPASTRHSWAPTWPRAPRARHRRRYNPGRSGRPLRPAPRRRRVSPSTSASASPKRVAPSATSRGMVPQVRSARGSSSSAGAPPIPDPAAPRSTEVSEGGLTGAGCSRR